MPQLAGSPLVLVSQPLATLLSQLPKPALHIPTVHIPAAQPATAFCALHFIPHMLQLFGSVASVASHPSAALPLQSPKPWVHLLTAHIDVMQDHIAFLPAQALPHRPQLARSIVTSLHCPPQQDSFPQSVLQPPQFLPSLSVSTQ